MLCAQALESARILLNSASGDHPNGLANSSGVLGHYLMDHHAAAGASGVYAEPAGRAVGDGPNRPNGIYVIRFRNTTTSPQEKDFIRGYGFQGGGAVAFTFWAPGYGLAYKKAVRSAAITCRSAGSARRCARFENHVEIDPAVPWTPSASRCSRCTWPSATTSRP